MRNQKPPHRQYYIDMMLILFQIGLISIIPVQTAEILPEFNFNMQYYGGTNGGVQLTLRGKGFAKNQFSFGAGNENLGNKVVLASETDTYPCDNNPDGHTEQQITCYTRPMPPDVYSIQITVDGELIPDKRICRGRHKTWYCLHRAMSHLSPEIRKVSPISSPPGQIIEIQGKIFTDLYGSDNATSSNGRPEKLLRVFAGPNKCEVKDLEENRRYGLKLTSGDMGYIKCKMLGTFVGSFNTSFLLNGPFGRSRVADQKYFVSRSGKLYQIQTYAEILSVEPTVGSVLGGTLLTIKGRNFDETTAKAKVYVGGKPCVIKSKVTDDTILCEVSSIPDDLPSIHPGNRGIKIESWDNRPSSLSKLLEYNDTNSGYIEQWHDNSDFTTTGGNKSIRLSGFLVPIYTGRHGLRSSSNGPVQFHLSTNESKEFMRQYSSSFEVDLVKDKRYYFEMLYENRYSKSTSQFLARMYSKTTTVSKSQTGNSVNMKQRITISSSVVKETIILKLDQLNKTDGSDEVQNLIIKRNPPQTDEAKFQLKFGEATTIPLSGTATAKEIQYALDGLPSLTKKVLVKIDTTSKTTNSFLITLKLPIGSLPLIGIQNVPNYNGKTLDVKIKKATDGVATNRQFSFILDGTMSPLLPVTPTQEQVSKALNEMFKVVCPSYIAAPSAGSYGYFNDFEGFRHGAYAHHGQILGDRTPFCGKNSIKNPTLMLHESSYQHSLDKFPFLCMSLHGDADFTMKVYYQYRSNPTAAPITKTVSIATRLTYLTEWKYFCWDILDAVKVTGGLMYKLKEIRIERKHKLLLLVDTVSLKSITGGTIMSELAGAYVRQLPPSSNRLAMREVKAKKLADNVFQVIFDVHNCTDNLPTLQTLPKEVLPSSQEKLQSSDKVSKDVLDKLAPGLWTLMKASPPLKGSFQISFQGNHSEYIPVEADTALFKKMLEAMPSMGSVKVAVNKKCSYVVYTIEWETKPGNHELVQVNTTKLSGLNVAASVRYDRYGLLNMNPITGEMFMTPHSLPQVVVHINNIPSAVAPGGKASFQWSELATPVITRVDPSKGSLPATLTIEGNGFSSIPADNHILIDNEVCTSIESSQTSIKCKLSKCSYGTHNVSLNVKGKGFARLNGTSVNFTSEAKVLSVAPLQGSEEGGTPITIGGYGFSGDMTVKIEDTICSDTNITPDKITCITPPKEKGAPKKPIQLELGKIDIPSVAEYTYTKPTADISAVSIDTAKVTGGDVLILTGSNLNDPVKLEIGPVPANIMSSNATNVVASLPPQGPGIHDIHLTIGNGFAAISSLTKAIKQVLYVSNVSPQKGSMYGGTQLVITGNGFLVSKELIQVKIGKDTTCEVDDYSDTWIRCTLQHRGKTHTVTNQGVHPEYGDGYKWTPNKVSLLVGDSVQWRWSVPLWLKNTKFQVQQVEDLFKNEPTSRGFFSGNKTANGVFTHQFTREGTYYYWSGPLDDVTIVEMRGIIEVKARSQTLEKVTVTVSGFEAQYNVNSTDKPASPSNTGCTASDTIIGSCSETALTPKKDAFYFHFSECSTPVAKSMSPHEGTSADKIVIKGHRLSKVKCENVVKFGEYYCPSIEQDDKKIVCKIETNKTFPIGVLRPLSLKVDNRGYALLDLDDSKQLNFGLLPHIQTISPNKGSTFGGTTITILGSGFVHKDSTVEVKIGYGRCVVQFVGYDYILCVTDKATADKLPPQNVQLLVVNGNRKVPAVCKIQQGCVFKYDDALTPVVTSVSPDNVTGSGIELTIKGSRFGSDKTKIKVKTSDVLCDVTSVKTTEIKCLTGNIPAGPSTLQVHKEGVGNLETNKINILSQPRLTKVSPSAGSYLGGTLITITGNGFEPNDTTVTINKKKCEIRTVNATTITCETAANSLGLKLLKVVSNGQTYPVENFIHDKANTPNTISITPIKGQAGDTLTLVGVGFSSKMENNHVMVGDSECKVFLATSNSINCTLGPHKTGSYNVKIKVDGKGLSTGQNKFMYDLVLKDFSPKTGGLYGGQKLTLTGDGFDPKDMTVKICTQICKADQTELHNSTTYICITPRKNNTDSCFIYLTVGNSQQTSSQSYVYKDSDTAQISDVTPSRGGTRGGTNVTITGSGFSSDPSENQVMIGGAICKVYSASPTSVQCRTTQPPEPVTASVELTVKDKGLANHTHAEFTYIDVWSSKATWGNADPPGKGEFLVINKGQKLLLDSDTPVLKMLLIRGGILEFDRKDVELRAENILITDGGKLLIGTPEAPFQQKAIITLYGHLRAKELPIYGTKVLGLRNGTLSLHGRPITHTWTHLATTAAAGTKTITLKHSVQDWKVGDEIIVASTGGRHSQRENEVHTITAISADYKTLTLNKSLAYEHISTSENVGGRTVEYRGEVGLLTRTIVVRGSRNTEWNEKIEACPDGFDTGEFATQTCFQGRFGEEMGSDEFGCQILIHAPERDTNLAIAHLNHVEVTFAGQAFRLGRYPIHFHLNGDMSKSHVRGCSVHQSFNRAINIHGTYNTLVERNVVYNIMGGALFLEDGIETGNIFQYNLAVFVKPSTSLRNEDIVPASFWVTNPNNIVRHNAVAGSSHIGYWYRMLSHPEGPSFTRGICPQKVPLGIFLNNTVHSVGEFGLWTFPKFFPKKGGHCNSMTDETAVFKGFTAWNVDKGAETVDSGAIQMEDFVIANARTSAFESKKMVTGPQFTAQSIAVKNSMVIAKSSVLKTTTTMETKTIGVVLPFGNGMRVDNVTFVNFKGKSAMFELAGIAGNCVNLCGGFQHLTSGLTLIGSPNIVNFRWQNEMILLDSDGTLTGTPNSKLLPTVDLLPPSCKDAAGFSINFPASICPPQVKFHRFAVNKIYPENFKYRNLVVSNSYGNITTPYKFKAATHKEGWMFLMVDGMEHKISFAGAKQVTNFSYSGTFYLFDDGDYVLLTQDKDTEPDRFTLNKRTFIPQSASMPTYQNNSYGDWFFNDTAKTLTYMISDRARVSRRKRSIQTARDFPITFEAYRCFYLKCIPPKDPRTLRPATKRPKEFYLWSSLDTWKKVNEALNISGTPQLPKDNENVTIPTGMWVVADITLPEINTLYIYGQLEISEKLPEVTISATYIHIVGGRLIIGWEDKPFPGKVTVELRGTQKTPQFGVKSGPNMGSKVIGVFGGLDMHGLKRGTQWTRLATTAKVGTKKLVLKQAVDWKAGEEIVLSATGYNAWETETFKIVSVSADKKTLTLNSSVTHEHVVHSEKINNKLVEITCEVGLLSHNIRVVGKDYADLNKELFGARIIVGVTQLVEESVFVGYIRLSNVELYQSGQYGWASPNDPRYSVSLHNLGSIDHNMRPTYIKDCSFHHGFSPAIGIYSSHGVTLENNVFHHTIGSGIISNSDNTTLKGNLLTLVICPDVFIRKLNFIGGVKWQAGIEAVKVEGLQLTNNVVAGSQRFGFRVNGENCQETSKWTGNIIRGALLGIGLFMGDVHPKMQQCVKYSGFSFIRCTDAGLYHNNAPGFIVEKSVFVENGLTVFPFVIGPSSLTHLTSTKQVIITDSVIVGLTSSYDCSIDRLSTSDPNIATSILARSKSKGKTIGLVWPTFTSSGNAAPDKPFFNIMGYPTISGIMKVEGVTFAHFNNKCGDKMRSIVLKTAPVNEDGQHPVYAKKCSMVDVDNDNLVFISRPSISSINPSDCVDMSCDGQKKALLVDTDGTLTGGTKPVSVFPQSEWEWNGDKRLGLGDYRIPKVALTHPNGTKMEVEELAANKGIIRNSECELNSKWQAYQCNSSQYVMMIIESLDEDTETRRLSPVAIIGNKYIDLINGPQDHGWCSGYTCRKRISTFMALVDPRNHFDIYFSSSSPMKLRLHLLNSVAKISVSVYYQSPNRQDVYTDTEKFIMPKNAYMDKGEMKYKRVKESNRNSYLPTTADPVGSNFFDRVEQKLYVIVEGGKPVDIRVNPVIVVTFTFGGLSESEFFGEDLVKNLALFLDIPASKVRIVDVVKEGGGSGGGSNRKKRSTSGMKVITEIGDPASSNNNSSDTVSNSSSSANNSLSTKNLQSLLSQIVNSQQLNTLEKHIKYKVTGMQMIPPVTPKSNSDNKAAAAAFTVKVPKQLKLVVNPKVSYEGGTFNQGPCLQFLDQSGVPLAVLGTPENPWRIKASLEKGKGSHSKAALLGDLEVPLTNGWANFTNIAISHKGSDYKIKFEVSYPVGANQFNTKVEPGLNVPRRPLTLKVTPSQFVAGKGKDLDIVLTDVITKQAIPDIKWRDHKWQVKAALVKPYLYYGSVYNIDSTVKEDTVNNKLVLNGLMFTKPGVYILQLTTTSKPEEYSIITEEEIRVKQSLLLVFSDPVSSSIKILVDIDYNKVGSANEKYFRVLMENYLIYKYPKVTFPEVLVSESENNMMDVSVKLYGNINEVSATSKLICDMAKEQQKITFNSQQAYIIFSIQVNGTRFLGSSCGSKDGKVTESDSFPLEIVVGVSVAVTLLLAGTIFFLLWKFQVISK